MKIGDLLKKEVMILDLKASTKEAVIDEMVDRLVAAKFVKDATLFRDGILAREAQTTTGLGDGIAIPHAKNGAVQQPVILFARSSSGVDYESLDGKPVHLFFMIAVPDGENDTHLVALADLSKYLLQDGFKDQLLVAPDVDTVHHLFDKDLVEVAEVSVSKSDKFLVAVTACTTGIAHTYMAEEALKKAAAEAGIRIKVETNGARGIDNLLTAAEIAQADGVIVAADKKVEMARFSGKHLINSPVAEGIRRPAELIQAALSGKTPVYRPEEVSDLGSDTSGKGLGQAFYKHLMSGVSAMLPFVVGGGILIALAFLIDQSMGVPASQLGKLGSYHPLAAYFKNIGSLAFGFMLPVLAGFIANSIADRPGLIAGFVAGQMAAMGLAIGKLDPDQMIPSGFLGALLGGFLAGGVLLLLKRIFRSLPKSLDGIKAILLYPLSGVALTGFFMLLLNVPMALINTGLSDFLSSLSGASAVLLGLVTGGMMAIDLGGPINKAAYIFATGTLAATVTTGGSIVMAAVMAGGMVPPLATAIAVFIFKSKFSKEERNSGGTNIVMGLSFITEGSIPFAAADPARAIPSFVVGAAVAGGLTGLAKIKLMAPHGGVFVLALANKPVYYLLCILIGSLVSGLIFGSLKRKG